MCTCSWMMTDQGYELWFSRDEDKRRPIGMAPTIEKSRKDAWVCPTDPLGQGTWIFSNNRGLSACLLNHYDAPTDNLKRAQESRGKLLAALTTSRSLMDFESGLSDRLRSSRFAPCRLVAINQGEGAALWTWNGHELFSRGLQKEVGMLTSSSWNSKDVAPVRRRCFKEMVPRQPVSSDFAQFHLSMAPEGPAYAVCMERPDTRTVSLSRIVCEREFTTFTYQNRAQSGRFEMPEVVELALRKSRK